MELLNDLNYLAVGEDGKYSEDGKYRSSFSQVERIVEEIVRSEAKSVDLYFHGGLVSEDSGEGSAHRVIKVLKDGEPQNSKTHQIAFIWKTDLLTTLRENLDDIFSYGFGRKLLAWTERAVSKKLSSGGRKSFVEEDGLTIKEIYEEWDASEKTGLPPFHDIKASQATTKTKSAKTGTSVEIDMLTHQLSVEIANEIAIDPNSKMEWQSLPTGIYLSSNAKEALENSTTQKGLFSAIALAKIVASTAFATFTRFREERDHGFHATIVEEVLRQVFLADVGQWVWRGMKQKAEEMSSREGCVGYDFLKELNKTDNSIKINIVGHSAGSICAGAFIDSILNEHRKIQIGKVALWAPACSSEFLKTNFLSNIDLIENFRMYTMNDFYERKDTLVNGRPWIYPSSLLYFISGVLEEYSDLPIAGMERFISGEGPYQTEDLLFIKDLLSKDNRLVLSKTDSTAMPGLRSDSLDHGEFNRDLETLKSLAHFFRFE